MAGVDPIWKFCQLLDRLIRNDKRIIDCLTAIARDYPALAPHLVDQLEARLYNFPDPYRKLYYLYVVDSLTFNVPATRDLLTRRINGMFSHAFKTADFNVKRDLDKLLIIWETQGRFPNDILEDMRERMAPTPPLISSPIDSPRGNGLFDLGDLVEWLNMNSSIPSYLVSQTIEDNYDLLFSRLLEGEKSRAELERLSSKIGYIDSRELPRMLLYELYEELPKQCLICGLRFPLESELDAHLDWHFHDNKKQQPKSPWLPNADLWSDPKYHLGLLEESKSQEYVEEQISYSICNPEQVLYKQLSCELCGETFETVTNNGVWMCKDAVRVYIEDAKTEVNLHKGCVNSISPDMDVVPATQSFFQDSFY